jgi:Isopenicillin N synthase and related dioxygenases
VHRVVHLQDKSRYSMPLFCNPNFRTIVDPRDLGVSDADAQYPPVMSGDFLLSRFKARASCGVPRTRRPRPDGNIVEQAAE